MDPEKRKFFQALMRYVSTTARKQIHQAKNYAAQGPVYLGVFYMTSGISAVKQDYKTAYVCNRRMQEVLGLVRQ